MDTTLPPGGDGVPDDEALARAGLRRVQAYIRTEQSKNAIRKARHCDRRAADGTRQMNIDAPDAEEARAALRALAAAMRAGTVSPVAVAQVIDRPTQAGGDPLADELARLRRVLVAGGWRAWVVRRAARGGVGAATS